MPPFLIILLFLGLGIKASLLQASSEDLGLLEKKIREYGVEQANLVTDLTMPPGRF